MRTLILVCTLVFPALVQGAEVDRVVAPDWTLVAADGRQVTLSEEASRQTTVLFFWATWCPYCKALMPHLQSMLLEYGDNIRILAINVFEDGDPNEFINNAGYGFALLLDGDDVADIYDVTGTPGVFVLDRDRVIHFDLRDLPRIEPPDTGKPASNSRKAAFRAPYWAAEIRMSIDRVLADAG